MGIRDDVPVTMAGESDQDSTGAGQQNGVCGHRSCSRETRKRKNPALSDDAEIDDEVELAARALDDVISAHLAAGGNRFVIAAACVWGGVKEMSDITSARSAADALRAIASQLDPPADAAGQRSGLRAEDSLMTMLEQGRSAGKQNDGQLNQVNQELASDVIGEAIDLIDQAQPDLARALLMALRARLVAGPRPQSPAPRRRWGG
jgi:hypothetical protein